MRSKRASRACAYLSLREQKQSVLLPMDCVHVKRTAVVNCSHAYKSRSSCADHIGCKWEWPHCT